MIAIDAVAVDVLAIDVLEWPGVNMAFLVSLIATTLLTLAAIPYGKRRPIGTPFSWGEAMLGATYAFGVLFLAFGVVPHQWIDHADKNLGWDRTRIVMGPFDILKPQSPHGGWNPITLQYEAVRDIVVVVIHVYFFGLLIFIWQWWQKRGQATTTAIETSTYGRPLVKKA